MRASHVANSNTFAVSPPLVAEPEHFEQIADGFRAGLDAIA